MPKNESISISVIRRLPRYYRYLGELSRQGYQKISSRELSEIMGLTASQIRQDLNCFGGFGQQGYGYNVAELRNKIGEILGIGNQYKAVLLGAGNLGRAIAMHMDFEKRGCDLVGIFDSDKKLEGTTVSGVEVMHNSMLASFCKENSPKMAILCIPRDAAQSVADELITLGVRAFWNFSHYDLRVNYKDILVENVHLGDSLLTLAYGLTDKENRNG